MGTPYATQHALTTQGGYRHCFTLKVPPKGTIRAIKIKQLSGDSVDAVAALYSMREACVPPAGESSSSTTCDACDGGQSYLGDPDLYRITPDINVVLGSYMGFQLEYMYRNRDRYAPNLQYALYLELTPEGTGEQTWGVTLEIECGDLSS